MSLGSAFEFGMYTIVPTKVSGAYEAFIEAFDRAATSANQEVKFDSNPLQRCFSKLGGGKVVFERCFYLKRWPSRLLGVNKRLDIIVHVLEELIPGSKWVLTKSTVYVNYLIVSNSKARLVQSLHYDFDADARPKYPHPLFHVQLNLEFVRFSENELRSMGFDAELEVPQEHNECWVTTRIPTPDMTFPSVLYCLVADHLGAGIFKQFAEDVNSILQGLPPPNFDTLRTSLRASTPHFKSSHWFAHNP